MDATTATNHNLYSFRVSECDGDTCAKAYIYYGGSWNLLDSSQNSPNCGCIEKADTWVFLDFYDGLANSHPNFSGGISFREGRSRSLTVLGTRGHMRTSPSADGWRRTRRTPIGAVTPLHGLSSR